MELNLYSSLVFAGIIQGFFLSLFILTFSKNRTRASGYLGLLIVCITFSNLLELLWEIEILSNKGYNLAYFPFSYLEAAFMYFFGMTFLYPERKNTWVEKLLYLPFILILVATVLIKLSYIPNLLEVEFFMEFRNVGNLVDAYGDFLSIIMSTVILLVLLREIKRYEKKFIKFDASKIKIQLRWLKILIGLLLGFMVLWIYVSVQYVEDSEASSDVLLVAISIMIYIFGYIGVRKIEVHEERKKIRRFSETNRDYSISEETKSKHIVTLEKILVEEKKYLDPTITLESLSGELGLSRSHLSRIINSELKTTFSDYINMLRVKEAEKYLLQPDFSNYTLVAIGLEAGFNSKTTFNSAFKKFAGVTPSAFKKLHKS